MRYYQKPKTKLNLGAGQKIIPDAVNLDIKPGENIDTICDIRKGLPFQDEQFREIIADYILQQIQDNGDFVKVMNDLWRILKPGGFLRLKVPNAEYSCAFKDPFDARYFTEETFDYFNREHYRYGYYSNYGFKPWTIVKIEKISGPNNKTKDRLYVEMRKSLRV